MVPLHTIEELDNEILNQLQIHATIIPLANVKTLGDILDIAFIHFGQGNYKFSADLLVYHNCELPEDVNDTTPKYSKTVKPLNFMTYNFHKLDILEPNEYIFINNKSKKILDLYINGDTYGVLVYPKNQHEVFTNPGIIRVLIQ
jgi:hypothetical protein